MHAGLLLLGLTAAKNDPIGEFGICNALHDPKHSAWLTYNTTWASFNDPRGYYMIDRCWSTRVVCDLHLTGGPELKLSYDTSMQPGTKIFPGKYVTVLGPATAYGIGARSAFGDLLRRRIGSPVLHLGRGRAGPETYVEETDEMDLVQDLVAQSAAVVIVIMAGRSSYNSAFPECEENRRLRGNCAMNRSKAMMEILQTDPARFQKLANESLDIADLNYKKFVDQVRSKSRAFGRPPPFVALLWLSKMDLRKGCIHPMTFPQYYVGRSAYQRLRALARTVGAELVDASYPRHPIGNDWNPHWMGRPLAMDQCVGCTPTESDHICGMEEARRLVHATKNSCVGSCGFVRNEYYATDEMHKHAADVLEPLIRDVLSWS